VSAGPLDRAADFEPRWWLPNGHLQTIAGNFLRRNDRDLPPAQPQLIRIPAAGALPAAAPSAATELSADPGPSAAMRRDAKRQNHTEALGTQVLCHCHWQPPEVRAYRTTVIILHGLEGSSNSQYVRGNAARMWRAGLNVVRMNMRNCGGTERLTPTLYHSGLSGDVAAVLHAVVAQHGLRRVALVGYSMGGNLVLKLAGELGKQAPPELCAVVGVSPAMDLGPSADALHLLSNRIYERKFLRALVKRYRRKTILFPRAYDPARAEGLKSLRDFDDRVTALYSGFANADDYYARAAAARVLDRIAVPTLILHALDDPFVRIMPETRAKIAANQHITFTETEHGGHCAFLAVPDSIDKEDDGYWAEKVLLRFIQKECSAGSEQNDGR
jgi:predicted alpha/beta-fold hydrolase